MIENKENRQTNIDFNPYYKTYAVQKPRNIDLLGQKFGNLTVIAKAHNTPYGQCQWVCKCACSEYSYKIVTTGCLNNGTTTTCKNCKKNLKPDVLIQDEGKFTPLRTDKEIQTNEIVSILSSFKLNGIDVKVPSQICVDKRFIKKSDVDAILSAIKQLFHQSESELSIK